jgi:hypothetical protein
MCQHARGHQLPIGYIETDCGAHNQMKTFSVSHRLMYPKFFAHKPTS